MFYRRSIGPYASNPELADLVKLYEYYLQDLNLTMREAARSCQFDGNITHIKGLVEAIEILCSSMQKQEAL